MQPSIQKSSKFNSLICHKKTLKPYFPAPKIIQGLFSIVNRLIRHRNYSSVKRLYGIRMHVILNLKIKGSVIGGFYFDLYARSGKRGGAWMSGFRSRMQTENGLQKPICYMVCNFTPPVGDQPALLTHDEVTTCIPRIWSWFTSHAH